MIVTWTFDSNKLRLHLHLTTRLCARSRFLGLWTRLLSLHCTVLRKLCVTCNRWWCYSLPCGRFIPWTVVCRYLQPFAVSFYYISVGLHWCSVFNISFCYPAAIMSVQNSDLYVCVCGSVWPCVSQITACGTAATFSRVVSTFKRHEISVTLCVLKLLRSVDSWRSYSKWLVEVLTQLCDEISTDYVDKSYLIIIRIKS